MPVIGSPADETSLIFGRAETVKRGQCKQACGCMTLAAALFGGCGTNGPFTTPRSFDGIWKTTGLSSGGGGRCITITAGYVTKIDDCMDESKLDLFDSQPASINGREVIWQFKLHNPTTVNGQPAVETIDAKFDMQVQIDGTLQGMATETTESDGGSVSAAFLMTRQ